VAAQDTNLPQFKKEYPKSNPTQYIPVVTSLYHAYEGRESESKK